MKAIVINDRMNLGNEGKEVEIVCEIPEYATIMFLEPGGLVKQTRVVRPVYLVKGIDRMQRANKQGNATVPVTFRYLDHFGSDLVSADEIEIKE